jgi:RNA polymerase sigma factor (sigma-70 family)
VSDPVSPELIAELRSGSPNAFQRVYASERVRLFGFLVRLCRDRNLAADLFQNTWLKLARSAPRLRADTDIRAWLFTVARNEYVSHRRAELLDLSRVLAVRHEHAGHVVPSASDASLEHLEWALSQLSDDDREILLLIGVEGLEPQQAASVLAISNDALRQRLSRARQRLAAQLSRSDATWAPMKPAK